jgi:23S rRNA (guanine745-N1)-methyltransferase
VKPYELEGFEFLRAQKVTYEMELEYSGDIMALFSMTPYYYRTGRDQQERLAKLDSLSTKADFELLVYRNI